MKLIGLLGGIASGKSVVARHLHSLGAAILDADRIGHEVLRLAEVKAAARARWGDRIFSQDGEIVRPALAKIVFAANQESQGELEYLEKLTHPEIRHKMLTELEQLAATGVEVAVLDAPVMLKAGWSKLCDHLVFVDSPREMRLERALARGWTEAEFSERESRQEPIEYKRELADFVLDNSGPLEYTHEQIELLWNRLAGS